MKKLIVESGANFKNFSMNVLNPEELESKPTGKQKTIIN